MLIYLLTLKATPQKIAPPGVPLQKREYDRIVVLGGLSSGLR